MLTLWAVLFRNSRRSQSIEIDIGNQSIHSISIDINRRLILIDIGNRSQSNSKKNYRFLSLSINR